MSNTTLSYPVWLDRLRSLVCAYPPEKRNRYFVMLNAFLDESDPGDRITGRFVISGYVANGCIWEEVSKQWAEILNIEPPLPYYKPSEFRSGIWESKYHLNTHQSKCRNRHFMNLLSDNESLLTSVCVDLNQQEFCRIVRNRSHSVPSILREPYYFCFHYFVAVATHKIRRLGIVGEQVDFVMDKGDVTTDRAAETFKGIRQIADPWLKEMLGSATPQSDKQTPALQAADMLSAFFKDHCLDPGNPGLRKTLRDLSWAGRRNATKHISSADLERFMSSPSIAAIVNKRPRSII